MKKIFSLFYQYFITNTIQLGAIQVNYQSLFSWCEEKVEFQRRK